MDLAYRARGLVTENLNLKLLSLASALALYSMVHGSQDAQRSVRLNLVALLPASPNRVLMTTIPDKINVTVRGAKSSLDDLSSDELGSVQLDLRGGTESRVVLEPAMIPVPPGLKVEQIDPPVIDLSWEDLVARDVPVQVGVVGTPAPGYVVKGSAAARPHLDPRTGAEEPRRRLAAGAHRRVRRDRAHRGPLHAPARHRPSPRSGSRSTRRACVGHGADRARGVRALSFSRVTIAVVGRASAKAQPADVDVRITCPSDVARALRSEQLVPRVQVASSADHASDVLPVELAIDQCAVHLTPPTVVVRW